MTVKERNPSMIAGIFYIFGVVVAAALLTFVVAMFRSVQSRDEWKSWRTFAFMFLACGAGPYLWAEGMTRYVGEDIKKGVLQGLNEAGLEGSLTYYKVTMAQGDSAKVIAIATDTEDWGGTARVVVTMNMKKKGNGKWMPATYKIVNSDKHNKDGFTFPPYF